jgi:hypothetical protein
MTAIMELIAAIIPELDPLPAFSDYSLTTLTVVVL